MGPSANSHFARKSVSLTFCVGSILLISNGCHCGRCIGPWRRQECRMDASPLPADGQRTIPYRISPHFSFTDFIVVVLLFDPRPCRPLIFLLFKRHRRECYFLVLMRRLCRHNPMMQMSLSIQMDSTQTYDGHCWG